MQQIRAMYHQDLKGKIEIYKETHILSFPPYLSNSRFPLWLKLSKALLPGPPLPLLRRPPLRPPRPRSGLSRSNLSTGLGKNGCNKRW